MRFNENPNFDEKKYFEKLNKKFKVEEERENKIIMEMKTTDNYINWVENFTAKHPILYDSFVYNFDLADLEPNDIEKINKLIDSIDCISNKRKEFYKKIIRIRYDIIMKAYNKITL